MVMARHRNPATLFADVPEVVRSNSNSKTRTLHTRLTERVGATGLEPATFRPPEFSGQPLQKFQNHLDSCVVTELKSFDNSFQIPRLFYLLHSLQRFIGDVSRLFVVVVVKMVNKSVYCTDMQHSNRFYLALFNRCLSPVFN